MSASSVSDFFDRYSDREFLIDRAGSLSYQEVARHCHGIAHALDSFGAKRVACYMPDSTALVSIMLGAAVGGQSMLVLNKEFSLDKVATLLEKFEIELDLHTQCFSNEDLASGALRREDYVNLQ